MHIFRIIELGLIFLSAVAHVNGASGEISSSSSSSELNKLQEQLHIYDAVDPAHSIHSRLLLNTASSKQDGEEEHEEHIQRRAMPLSSLQI